MAERKINLNEKDVYNNPRYMRFEEKIFFNFEKTIFDREFLSFNDMENILRNTKSIVENSLIELKREKRILRKDEIKVNFYRSSFHFEILIPLITPYFIQGGEILFNFLKNFFNPLRVKHDDEGFQKIRSNPKFKNKNINGSVHNIINNYNLNFTIGDKNNDEDNLIGFDKEEEAKNIKENLGKLDEEYKEIKTEKHFGRIIQANKISEKKDLFQLKNSSKGIKIEFPKISEEEKTKLFDKEKIGIIAETHYLGGEIEKLIVKEVIDSKDKNLLDFMEK